MKPLVKKQILRQWIIGSYLESRFDDISLITKDDMKKASEYAIEVIRFLESNYLLHPEIK